MIGTFGVAREFPVEKAAGGTAEMEMFRLGVQQATVGDWVVTFLIVGLVVYFTVPGLWFSKSTHETPAREKRKKE